MSYNTATLLLGSSIFDQKKYLNESIRLISKQLGHIKKIGKQMGRKERIPRENEIYCDREIDIDILFFNELRYCSNRLLLPHHQVKTRPFVEQMLSDLTEI